MTFESVRVERSARAILDIPSLHVNGGRTTAILGPNGSGKTTLLRLIAGLERAARGQVLIGGAPLRRGQHLAYVFQEQVFLRQSVRKNLELGLRVRGVAKSERRDRVEAAAALLGIAHLLDRPADHLSGGEGRRANLARALCMKAPLALLDEPLEGLDERTYYRLLDELPRVLVAFAATTLLVTHNRHEALRLAEDLVVLVDGRIRAAGDKREVATNPGVREVADALGYAVLDLAGRCVAVPPGGLALGPGAVQFSMIVDDIIDLVERRDITGLIGGTRVHVESLVPGAMPGRGDRVLLHAERHYELDGSADVPL